MKISYRSEYLNKLDGGALYERDVLNVVLSNAYGGRDMSDIADRLLDRFPSIGAILRADVAEITAVRGVSERVALYLKTLSMLERYNPVYEITEIKDVDDFLSKLTGRFNSRDSECAEFYLVNARGKITDYTAFTSYSAHRIALRTEDFLAFLTGSKGCALYCVHNHVGGPCHPSKADDEITGRIALLSSMCNVKFIDHVIINSKGEFFSYAKSGRLDKLIGE